MTELEALRQVAETARALWSEQYGTAPRDRSEDAIHEARRAFESAYLRWFQAFGVARPAPGTETMALWKDSNGRYELLDKDRTMVAPNWTFIGLVTLQVSGGGQ